MGFGSNNQLKSQFQDEYFYHITIDDGLPGNQVYAMEQDPDGFIWFATENGLVKYDGYSFILYQHNPDDVNSLVSNSLKSLVIDNKERMWIGGVGLNVLDLKSNKIKRIHYEFGSPIVSLNIDTLDRIWLSTRKNGIYIFDQKSNAVFQVHSPFDTEYKQLSEPLNISLTDSENRFWAGIQGAGLYTFNPPENKIVPAFESKQRVYATDNFNVPVSDISVLDIIELDGNLWLGTRYGLVKYNPELNHYQLFKYKDFNQNDPQATTISAIEADNQNKIWCGTIKSGIHIFDAEQEKFIDEFRHHLQDPESLISDNITCIFIPESYSSGLVWIGTPQGISKFNTQQKQFMLYKHIPNSKKGLSGPDVRSVIEDSRGDIWVGSAHHGITIINPTTNSYQYIQFNDRNSTIVGAGEIGSIHEASKNSYWITTWRGSISYFNKATGDSKRWQAFTSSTNLTGWVFCDLQVYRNNEVWVAVLSEGLQCLNLKTNQFRNYRHEPDNPNSLPGNTIKQIYLSPYDSSLWFATGRGISRYNPEKDNFSNYLNQVNKVSIAYNQFEVIFEDRYRNMWIGTKENGLYLFDKETDDFIRFSAEHGLPGNNVFAIYEDNRSNLWLMLQNSISRFHLPDSFFAVRDFKVKKELILNGDYKPVIKTYDKNDGLQSNQFNWGAHYQNRMNKKIYFGGSQGLTVFYPDSIRDNPNPPQVVFSELQLFNKKVLPLDTINKQVVLTQILNRTDTLVLNHKNNDFTIVFSSTNFLNPKQNIYSYILEGYDENWKEVSSDIRQASYTNLDEGIYLLKVKAATNDRIWTTTPKQLLIEIKPPFWGTAWFKVLIVFIILMMTLLIIRIRTIQLSRQKRILERLVEARTLELKKQKTETEDMAKKMHEADESKLRFYTNVSHELRTPLTLILGPATDALNSLTQDNHLYKPLTLIKDNANRLLRLINNLLELRKIEVNTMKLYPESGSVLNFISTVYQRFEHSAEKRNIVLEYSVYDQNSATGMEYMFDHDKLDTILSNLLSNALKYTPEFGKIVLSASIEKIDDRMNLEVSVKDSGRGIPEGDISNIFTRFFKASNSVNRVQAGSGIGLSLVKELVELHEGSIGIKSELNKGTEISFNIRLYEPSPNTRTDSLMSNKSAIDEKLKPKEGDHTRQDKIVLLAEDDDELREYTANQLSGIYDVVQAENGLRGLELARDIVPDIILSDIMMPEMDGLEFCRKIKNDERTSHIPVILLTAKHGLDNEISGLSSGANDYIEKPYNREILLLKIKNVIQDRENLKITFGKVPDLALTNSKIDSMDDKFVKKLNQIIREHISDTELSGEWLADEIGLSRRQLQRKLNALSGNTINEFIRNIRLNFAAECLSNKTGTVSEICYQSGFSSPSYFTKCFKERFHVSPSEYK